MGGFFIISLACNIIYYVFYGRMDIRSLKFAYTLLALLLACTALSQENSARIHMMNGEYYEGQIVAITSERVLVRQGTNIRSLDRDNIRYVFSDRARPVVASQSPVPVGGLEPLNKKFMSELEGALTIPSPFALKMAYTEWYRFNDKWSFGLGTSFQFFRYSMLNLSGHARRYSQGKFFKVFAEGEAAISIYESVTSIQASYFDFDFGPVKQLGCYGGFWLDTGYQLAFAIKMGASFTWYRLTEFYTPDFKVEGQYFKGSPVFSCSMLF